MVGRPCAHRLCVPTISDHDAPQPSERGSVSQSSTSASRPAVSAQALIGAVALGAASAAVNFANTLGPGNVIVVRSTGATTANLDEFLSTTASQSAYVQTLSVTGCNTATTLDSVYASPSTNGYYAVFPCGLSSTTSRVIARVSSTGAVDTSTTYSSSTASYLPRGAATSDGSQMSSSDAHGITIGTFGTNFGSATTTSDFYYGSAVGTFSGEQHGADSPRRTRRARVRGGYTPSSAVFAIPPHHPPAHSHPTSSTHPLAPTSRWPRHHHDGL